jgi:hypothetical protein
VLRQSLPPLSCMTTSALSRMADAMAFLLFGVCDGR